MKEIDNVKEIISAHMDILTEKYHFKGETIAAALHATGIKVLKMSIIYSRFCGFFCANFLKYQITYIVLKKGQ
jgi:hypothetical protein